MSNHSQETSTFDDGGLMLDSSKTQMPVPNLGLLAINTKNCIMLHAISKQSGQIKCHDIYILEQKMLFRCYANIFC